MFFEFKSVKTRLIVWFLLIALIPLIAVMTITYQQRVKSTKEEAFQKLIAIRDLKLTQVNNWLDSITGDVTLLAENPAVRRLNTSAMSGNKSYSASENMAEIREIFRARIKNHKEYSEIFFIAAQTGKVTVASRNDLEGQDRSRDIMFTAPLSNRSFFIKDIHYSQTLHQPALTFSMPVFDLDNRDDIIGIVVARIDLNQSLYSMLLGRPGMGQTGETLIVNKDVIALNELRWYENAPLKLKINAFPAIQASTGKEGIIEVEDYRKKMVLAAYAYIPQTGWGFVAKQDLSEIYKPIKELIRNSIIIIICCFIVIFVIAWLVASAIAEPLKTMTIIANQLQDGDFSVRNRLERSDEFGSLATSFDRTSETLTNKMIIQEKVAEIMDSVVSARTITDFTNTLLRLFVKITSSDLGAIHLLEDKHYVPVTSLGASPELLEPIHSEQLTGEIGKAVSLEEICHLRDITKDTFFQLHTFSGKIVPKEIITIPLLNREKVEGVISIASTSGYSTQHLEIINAAWVGLNTGISSILADDKRRKMAANLQENNLELEEQKHQLQRQSDELQEQNVELEAQKRQVEEATRLKSEFLSNMSHELRTPLNSIMALSKVLIMETRELLDKEQQKYLEVISRNGKNLLKLINDILDLSKIEAGRMDLFPSKISVRHFLQTLIESFEVLCLEKGIQISLDIPEELPQIKSDENRVHQLLQNIISNAVKFTQDGSVTVRAVMKNRNIHITIQDTGIGITEEDLPYIFGEFKQVDGSSSRSFGGTGLGLTIAKKSAELIDAAIDVTSIPGRGTCFTIDLPVSWQGLQQQDSENILPLISAPIITGLKTVLVVDDDPDIARTIANFLNTAGYNTVTACSGKEALLIAQTHQLFAITMDIVMPDLDGWEVIQQLKANPETAPVPVIIVSVSDDRQTGFALGASDFITKPVDKEQLIRSLDNISRTKIQSVMVVDDNAIDRDNIVQILKEYSLDITETDGGLPCLELLEEKVPDLIILDLMMPDMGGFEVLTTIRGSSATVNTPVLIVTAKDLTREDKETLNRQMVPVIEKNNLSIHSLWDTLRHRLKFLDLPAPEKTRGAVQKKKTILIVEDNPDTVIQIKQALEKSGYFVSTATGGAEALEYIKQAIPDGIILDLMMPEVDGFEVLERIRGTADTASLPVLILTAKDLTKDDLKRLSHNNIQQLVQKGDIDLEGLLFKTELMLGNQPRISATTHPGKTGGQTNGESTTSSRELASKVKSESPVILIVEDNPDNMTTLKAVLKNRYTILEAMDGEEGLQKVLKYYPDLVLLDISLPRMDGYEVASRIKKDALTRTIPVVAVTAHTMKGDRERVLAAGCDDYISKPVDDEKIAECLNKWLPAFKRTP